MNISFDMVNVNNSGKLSVETGVDEDSSAQDETIIVPKKDLSIQKLDPISSSVGKKRKRGKYKRRDYPKKALSAYNIFFKETRGKILREHGKTNFQEMVRKIAALWKEITPEDKIRFDSIASRDLVRYQREVSEYERYIIEKSQEQSIIEENKEESSTKRPIRNSVFDTAADGINKNDNKITRNRSQAQTNGMKIDQTPPDNCDYDSTHTLTCDELEMAHRCLNEEHRNTTTQDFQIEKKNTDRSLTSRISEKGNEPLQ